MSAADAIFDLAVNRAQAFLRGAGPRGNLKNWHARTRFAARVPLEAIERALEIRPTQGEWHWSGGLSGAWHPGTARTP